MFIHSLTDGYLSCFQVGGITNKAAVIICYISIYKEVYFKKLAQVIMELANLASLRQAGRWETQAGVEAAVLKQNSFLSRKSQFLFLKPSTD